MTSATELTVEQLLHHLLPRGTRGTACDITKVPLWPLDLFGVTAYLVQQSDCHTRLLEYANNGIGKRIAEAIPNLENAGLVWSQQQSDLDNATKLQEHENLKLIHSAWATIIKNGTCPVSDIRKNDELVLALLSLVAISDQACSLVGFYFDVEDDASTDTNEDANWIRYMYPYATHPDARLNITPSNGNWYAAFSANTPELLEEHIPYPSGCLLIPPDRLCVLPKSHTPSLGCTLRSLTHNLALHPSATQVKSIWNNYQWFELNPMGNTLNILIIPYPYEIDPNDFVDCTHPGSSYHGFTIRQSWLEQDKDRLPDFVEKLICLCEQEKSIPDIVVFPEASLNVAIHEAILLRLAQRLPKLIVIAGLAEANDGHHFNYSLTSYLRDGKIILSTGQDKHHRWKLDKDQINSYALASSLAPEHGWWELSEIDERTVGYHVFGNGVCFATLICEDLARTDPCKPSINASAPNLVFALLMDGPQLANRWPGRYALGLADDPGTSILTITSLGLVARSNWAYNSARQTVALWGGPGVIKDLDLPANKQALVLTIEKCETERSSLDGRVSADLAVSWILKGHKAIGSNEMALNRSIWHTDE